MIFRILVVLVVLLPLPFAAVYPWTWTLLASVVGILLIAWSAKLLISSERPAFGIHRTWPLLVPFFLVVGWAAVQATSAMPGSLHHPLWQRASSVLGTDLIGSISLNPADTRDALLRLLAYGGIFWLSLQSCQDIKRARRAIHALAIAGVFYSAYGLVVEFTDSQTILWYAKRSYNFDLTSTFVNKNSYATYAGLTLICISGMILKDIFGVLDRHHSYRDRAQEFLKEFLGRRWVLLLGWITILTALLLSHSRAGTVSVLLGLFVLFLAFRYVHSSKSRSVAVIAVLFLFTITGVVTVSGKVLDERLANTPSDLEGRIQIYALSGEAIKSAPLVGTGYGTFEEVFRIYRTEDVKGNFDKAHNTYIENTLELGIIGALPFFGSIIGLLILSIRGLRQRHKNAIYPAVGIAATILVATHSLVDFSLQIPAVAASYSFLMGACCAQSLRVRHQRYWDAVGPE